MTTQVADADQIVGVYQPKDAIGPTITALGVTGSAGAFVSAIQSTLTKQNVGAMSFITRTGGSIALFGMDIGRYARSGWKEALTQVSNSVYGRNFCLRQERLGQFERKG